MSKIADALKKADQKRLNTISPTREGRGFSTGYSKEGKMRRSWLTWIFVVAVVTAFIVFNYQEGKDAVPLSEIFPDEEVFPVDVEYEFAQEETTPTEANKTVPVIQEAKAVTPSEESVQNVIPENVVSTAGTAAYTIQIASFKDKKRAEEALVSVRVKVPSAYIASRDLGEKGVWYRIYAGQFTRRNEAEVTLSDIQQNYDSSFIISPKRAK